MQQQNLVLEIKYNFFRKIEKNSYNCFGIYIILLLLSTLNNLLLSKWFNVS